MEYKFFEDGTIPDYSTPEWYDSRERAPHLDQEIHQPRLKVATQLVVEAINDEHPSVVDLGAGDGGLLWLLNNPRPPGLALSWGYDLQWTNIEGAGERGVDIRYGDVINDVIQWGTIAVATEMLEHLVDPHGFVRKIAEHCDVMVCSSPWNETPESHYGFHLWGWDEEGYRALLEDNGWYVDQHLLAGSFQIMRGRRAR